MVTVTNFFTRERSDGSTFTVLELTGGLELVQSQTTGNFYATTRRCTIPSTFDESVAKLMIGQQVEGEIVRVQVPEYSFVNKKTGEIMTLQHSYAYRPKGALELIGETQVSEVAASL